MAKQFSPSMHMEMGSEKLKKKMTCVPKFNLKQFTLGKGQIREFGSRIGYHFQENYQLVENFSLD